ncbi:MAG: hypothetical protein AB1482_05610 [Pseudomonadota bacterium]
MSLLSPSVRIALTPGRVAVAAGGDRREAAVATPGWAGALAELPALLADARLRGRASVTLSHHFAQVHLLPSPPLALRPVEQQGWIRDQLARQFGEAARDWQVAWQAEPPGAPFLAAGVEPARLAELDGVLRSASLKAAAVQPWLVGAWNRQRRRLGRGRAWMALAEPGRLTLLALAGGRATRLRSALAQDDPAAALAGLLTREALLAGEENPAPLWIESAGVRADWQATAGGRSVQVLPAGRAALDAMLEA